MGFSIGRFLGSIARVAAPILGAVVGGPAGALIGTAIGGGISAGFGPNGVSQAGPSPLLSTVAFPRIPSLPGPTVQPAGVALAPLVAGGAAALIRSLLARASAFLGRQVSASRVLALVREVGIVAAAAALGLTAIEVAQILAVQPRRRRRGISASNIRTTKRVLRTVHSIQHDLSHLAGPVRRIRHHHHRRAS
jgi:hypothetical protein